MFSMEKSTKAKKEKKPQSGAGASSAVGRQPHGPQTQWKRQKVSISSGHLLQMWERQTPKSTGLQKLWMQHAEDVERKDTLRRFVSRGNTPHTL